MNAINQNMTSVINPSSYHAIRMLMGNALNYMQEAADAFDAGSGEGWCSAIVKAHGYILGLRASLDLENGGSIADNLDNLYEYMQARLNHAFEEVDVEALAEVFELMEEIKSGWDGIEDFAEQAQALHA
jgi:flagellar secretion chaperone FliS